MKKIGFVISQKENEKRRAILLDDAKGGIQSKDSVYFEVGYGDGYDVADEEFVEAGFKVTTREEILRECDVVVDPKIGDAEYLEGLKEQTIFGWVHATQNYEIAQQLIDNKLTAYAWEKMFDDEKHIFYRNNEIAGEAAILHVMLVWGDTVCDKKVALIGRGNTARGARRILEALGAKVVGFYRGEEEKLRGSIGEFDMIVNCVLWDTARKDHIIYRSDLGKMKRGAVIVDVSCDRNGGIETSIPTTVDDPVYRVDGVLHYVVDHTPTLLYKDATRSISREIVKYVDQLITDNEDEVLRACEIVRAGKILDKEIIEFQRR